MPSINKEKIYYKGFIIGVILFLLLGLLNLFFGVLQNTGLSVRIYFHINRKGKCSNQYYFKKILKIAYFDEQNENQNIGMDENENEREAISNNI